MCGGAAIGESQQKEKRAIHVNEGVVSRAAPLASRRVAAMRTWRPGVQAGVPDAQSEAPSAGPEAPAAPADAPEPVVAPTAQHTADGTGARAEAPAVYHEAPAGHPTDAPVAQRGETGVRAGATGVREAPAAQQEAPVPQEADAMRVWVHAPDAQHETPAGQPTDATGLRAEAPDEQVEAAVAQYAAGGLDAPAGAPDEQVHLPVQHTADDTGVWADTPADKYEVPACAPVAQPEETLGVNPVRADATGVRAEAPAVQQEAPVRQVADAMSVSGFGFTLNRASGGARHAMSRSPEGAEAVSVQVVSSECGPNARPAGKRKMSQQQCDQLTAARMAKRFKNLHGASAMTVQLAERTVVADGFGNGRAADGYDKVPEVSLAELQTSVLLDSKLATRRSGKVGKPTEGRTGTAVGPECSLEEAGSRRLPVCTAASQVIGEAGSETAQPATPPAASASASGAGQCVALPAAEDVLNRKPCDCPPAGFPFWDSTSGVFSNATGDPHPVNAANRRAAAAEVAEDKHEVEIEFLGFEDETDEDEMDVEEEEERAAPASGAGAASSSASALAAPAKNGVATVRALLAAFYLEDYANVFENLGYVSVDYLWGLRGEENRDELDRLFDAAGILEGHRMKFLTYLERLLSLPRMCLSSSTEGVCVGSANSDDHMAPVREALGRMDLLQYAATFAELGFDNLKFLMEMGEADRLRMVAVEAKMLPGHEARFVDWISIVGKHVTSAILRAQA